jgi:cytochrome c-type biogenesis protein CcmH
MIRGMAEAATSGRRSSAATIILALAALLAAAALAYALFFKQSGDSPATASAAAANGMAAGEPGNADEMIAQLIQRLRADPDNHEGWFMLGLAFRETMRFPEAAQAFRRAMELQPRNADYNAYLAEMLLIDATRANRPPPPEAETLFRRVVELQPGNPQARFYLATIKDTRGDHRGAVDDLIALLRDAPADQPWPRQVRESAIAIAGLHHIDISGRLPPEPAAPAAPPASAATAAIPGPTPEQMRQAAAMTPSQQAAASRAMVDRLAARLAADPRNADGWIRLMRSRMVLQDPRAAAEALRAGLGAFRDDPATQARLRSAAGELGVPAG